MTAEIPGRRDEQRRWLPHEIERAAMRQAALREGYAAPGVRGETPRDWVCRAAGVEPRSWGDLAAVDANCASAGRQGSLPGRTRG